MTNEGAEGSIILLCQFCCMQNSHCGFQIWSAYFKHHPNFRQVCPVSSNDFLQDTVPLENLAMYAVDQTGITKYVYNYCGTTQDITHSKHEFQTDRISEVTSISEYHQDKLCWYYFWCCSNFKVVFKTSGDIPRNITSKFKNSCFKC